VRDVSLDHVQIAAPPGCEPGERRFYSEDPWGSRIEFLASAS
jgi:hypothetical protein